MSIWKQDSILLCRWVQSSSIITVCASPRKKQEARHLTVKKSTLTGRFGKISFLHPLPICSFGKTGLKRSFVRLERTILLQHRPYHRPSWFMVDGEWSWRSASNFDCLFNWKGLPIIKWNGQWPALLPFPPPAFQSLAPTPPHPLCIVHCNRLVYM
jgi:hypothetical protein